MVLSKTLNILVYHKLHKIDMCEHHVFWNQCCNLQIILFLPERIYKGMHQCLILQCQMPRKHSYIFKAILFQIKCHAHCLPSFTLEMNSSRYSCRPSITLFCLQFHYVQVQHHSTGCTCTEKEVKETSWELYITN